MDPSAEVVHHHSLIIQFLDRVSEPGPDPTWSHFWRLRDVQTLVRHRLSDRESLHGPLGLRMQFGEEIRRRESIEFFSLGPGESELD